MADEREGPRGSREPSDMFRVGDAVSAIPSMGEVPLTKEEIERRRRVRITIVVTSVIIAIVVVLVAAHLYHRNAINSARVEAERTGRLPAIAAALAQLEGETGAGDAALAARLHAMAELAGESGHRERARALLDAHDATSDGASDHRIAEVYLALASGDVPAALAQATPLSPSGPRAAEAGVARALAAAAAGNLEQALASARGAASAMPDAPRHQALLVEIAARAGTPETAADVAPSAALAVAHAIAAAYAGGGAAGVRTAAQQALADADATPSERARASMLVGLADAVEGDTVAARAHVPADPASTLHDELIDMLRAEAWLLVGDREHASAIVSALPSTTTADPGLRARLHALLALSDGNPGAAELALASVPDGAAKAWVQARIARSRGQLDAARAAYARAASDPLCGVVASSELAELEASASQGAAALAAIEPLLAASGTVPRVAAAAGYALSAAGQHDRAVQVLDAAIAAHGEEPTLFASKGHVHFVASEWQPAVAAFDAAVAHGLHDAVVQRDLGLALRALGQNDRARAALAEAVTLAPRDGTAILPLLTLQVAAGELVPARETLTRADAAGLSGDDLEHLRAQVLVGTQAGQSGIRAVQAALRTRRRDGDLHLALARLEMQAERWGDASLELATLTPDTEPRLTAQLLRILALGHMGREAPVEQATEQVRAAVTPEAPLTNPQEAMLAVAQAWVELHDEARERAGVLARRALELDPGNPEAELVLAGIETQLGHDPEEHLRAALAGHPTPPLALGALALGGTLDAERCDFGRRYVAAAPTGQYARDVRARIAACH